ncbi:MAG: DNA repair protein RecN [Flavobacteriales bacterium]
MLRHLEVINYGLIDHVQLDFQNGLTAITGETGSGKSILLGAFGLLLGERADSKSIKNADQKCIVEASFELGKFNLKSFFSENDLDFENVTTIRREIAVNGKSRAFINDTPVSLQQLKALGECLVDIHSQHQNSILSERNYQFSVVDAFAGNENILADYKEQFKVYRAQQSELNVLLDSEAKLKQDLDYFQFQLEELEKYNLEELDIKALEDEVEVLNNAEHIQGSLSNVTDILSGENGSVLNAISTAKSILQKIAAHNSQLEDFSSRLESAQIELKELSRELEDFSENIQMDPARLEKMQDILSAAYHLQQKHRLQSTEELIQLREELREKVNVTNNIDDKIASLKNEIIKTEHSLGSLSKELSTSRKKGSEKAQREVSVYFKELSLEHAEMVFEITDSKDYHSLGKNEVQLLFKANKGGQLLPVQKVASGGEISRVMLALKASISKHKNLPVLILDEIDQGVSGEVGKKIGSILKQMSGAMQLITITHLPQIAGKADHHLKVRKETSEKDTTTLVEPLNYDHRVKELAEMLSGKDISNAAIENAKELMN